MKVNIQTTRVNPNDVDVPKKYDGPIKSPEVQSIAETVLGKENPIHYLSTIRVEKCNSVYGGEYQYKMTNEYVNLLSEPYRNATRTDDETDYWEEYDGLYHEKNGECKSIINAKIKVVKKCIVSDSRKKVAWLKCLLYRDSDNYKKMICVPLNEYKDLPKRIRKECPEIYINFKYISILEKYLTDIFNKVKDRIESEYVDINRGWHESNGVTKFDDSVNGIEYLRQLGIIYDGNNTAPIVRVDDKIDKRWEYFNDGKRFINVGKKGKEITAIYLFGFLGFAKYWIEKAMIQCHFVLYVCGMTNSLKTSVVQCVTNVFEQDVRKKNLRFTGTRASILDYISTHQDDTILVDDFSNTEVTSKKKSREMIETILRVAGDDMIPTKMGSSGEIHYRNFRCAIVMTGETEADLSKSSQLRMMKVNVDRNTFDGYELRRFQENPQIMRVHLAQFILFLEEYGNAMIPKMKERIQSMRETFRNEFEPRFVDTIVVYKLLIMLWGEFGRWAGYDSAMLYEESERFEEHILDIMRQNESYCKFLNPGIQFIYAMEKIIVSDAKAMIACSEEVFNLDDKAYVGFYEQGEEVMWLKFDNMYKMVRAYWQGLGIDFISTTKQVKESLCQCGLIRTTQNSRGGIDYTIKAKKGRRQRMVVFYVKKYKKILEENEV